MYYCKNCGKKFNKPKKDYEKHGFSNPPFEKIHLCPFCNSTDFIEMGHTHCRCCGALIIKSQSEYCSSSCKTKGEKMWKEQAERFKAQYTSPINIILRELKEYNLKNNTDYSYGQYVGLILSKRGNKKCSKKKSDI